MSYLVHSLLTLLAHIYLRMINAVFVTHMLHAYMQLMAMSYDSLLKGAPPPPCNSERLAAMADVNIMDAPPDPQVHPNIDRTFAPSCMHAFAPWFGLICWSDHPAGREHSAAHITGVPSGHCSGLPVL